MKKMITHKKYRYAATGVVVLAIFATAAVIFMFVPGYAITVSSATGHILVQKGNQSGEVAAATIPGLGCTGGTVTTDTKGDEIHTFDAGGTLTCTGTGTVAVNLLLVGGGGAGGAGADGSANLGVMGGYGGGGGGAGGYYATTTYQLSSGTYTVVVGVGGDNANGGSRAQSGTDSTIYSVNNGITAAIGGGGGGSTVGGRYGGSGGGGANANPGGLASTGLYYGQGNAGGEGGFVPLINGGGGGGASSAGGMGGGSDQGGYGGSGRIYPLTGITYAGGGGGGGGDWDYYSGYTGGGAGGGGAGGGGAGGGDAGYGYPTGAQPTTGGNGIPNTGGGGGGGAGGGYVGGNGGSGIVIIVIPPASSIPPVSTAGYDCVSNACSAVSSGAQYSSLSACSAGCGVVSPTSTPTSTPPSGTITVTSENSQNTSTLVNAAWDLTGPVTNNATNGSSTNGIVCSATGDVTDKAGPLTVLWNGSTCSGEQARYSGVPANDSNYTLPPTATTTAPNYTFNSIKQIPIAENKSTNILDTVKLSLGNIFSTVALAQEYTLAGSNTSIPNGISGTLTPTPPNNSVAFVILWTPHVSDMQVSSTVASFTPSGSMSQAETITAIGAPAANLYWTATTSTTSGGAWLDVSPSGGTMQLDGSGNGTTTATISAVNGLPDGTYQGTVAFKGYNDNAQGTYIKTRTVSVTLTVGKGGVPTYYICTNPMAGTCATTSTPGYGSCNAACVGNPRSVSASCSPASITTAQTSQCSVSLNGTAQNNASWALSSGTAGGSIGASTGKYTPSAAGEETVGGTLPDGTLATTTIPVTPTVPQLLPCTPTGPGANCPVCNPQLTANPTSIVVPESSNLSYSCSNSPQCWLTGGIYNNTSEPASDTISVNPSSTTAYTLVCGNTNYAPNKNNPVSFSATVTVSGSSYCEQNPNGVGCQ